MKIKYGELPTKEICQKLVSVSFGEPKKNLSVYKFCSAVNNHINYVENERTKLFQKYGTEKDDEPGSYIIPNGTEEFKKFKKEWESLIEMEIEEELPTLSLTEDDFLDQNCSYSQDKSKWMNAVDIATVLRFCQ